MNWGYANKTIAALITAFGGAYATANLDGSVTGSEWVAIAVTTVIAVGAVFTIPNAQGEPKPEPLVLDPTEGVLILPEPDGKHAAA